MNIKRLEIFSIAAHIEQIVTGLMLLEKQGQVTIDQVVLGDYHGHKETYGPYLKAHVENDVLLFDTSDQFEIVPNQGVLKDVTHYFKRSHKIGGYSAEHFKVYPLGLNCLVYGHQPNICTMAQVKFALNQGQFTRYIARYNKVLATTLSTNSSVNNRNYKKFKDIYSTKKEDLVLFNTRLWDPKTAKDELERDRRRVLNERRIAFVGALKSTFGDRFKGGIFNNNVAQRTCPSELIVKNQAEYKQKKYQKLLRKAKVGVSVNGNHSAGWSLAEFCSFGVGIICDPLTVNVPGSFTPNTNYLEASTPDDLIAATEALLTNKAGITHTVVKANYQYYRDYIKPDKMVWNALAVYINSKKKSTTSISN